MVGPGSLRAAQYVRMSTEHQRYSPEYQMAVNGAYAQTHGLQLVKTYTDAGVSGLTLSKRAGLKALLSDVLGGQADYGIVLVYDVSRWGRFQDPDQSAHYEFICREAGVRIAYTAEPFDNDGSLTSTLVKHLKRAMAAEYSRELSEKVSRAKRGLGAKGYFQGGHAGYGYRRASLDRDGAIARIIESGERNPVAGGRVTLVPGPSEEVEVVQRIFALRRAWFTLRAIADQLNAEGIAGPTGRPWEGSTIKIILGNEKYMGVKVTGRTRQHLGATTHEPRANWLRKSGAFPALVSRDAFEAVQSVRRPKWPHVTDAALLEALRTVLSDRGKLSFSIIRRDPRTPFPTTYVARFGSLGAAYRLIGYEPSPQQRLAAARIRQHKPHLRRAAAKAADPPGARDGDA